MKKNLKFKSVGQQIIDSFGKMGVQKHLAALRDGFSLIIPIMLAGAISILIKTFVFGSETPPQSSILGWFAYATNEVDKSVDNAHSLIKGTNAYAVSDMGRYAAMTVTNATINMMSVFFSISFGYFLAVAKGSNSPIIASTVGLAGFLTGTFAKRELMGAEGLLAAIFLTIIAVELFCVFERSKALIIRMPDGVPPIISRAFAKLFPVIISILIIAVLNSPFVIMGYYTGHVPEFNIEGSANSWSIGDAIFSGVQSPFLTFAGSTDGGLSIALVYVCAISLLWFFGIHGTSVMNGIFTPIWLALYSENALKGANNIFVAGTFDAFIFLGGAGATLSLLIAIFIFSKRKEERSIAKISIGPSIFQINEPVIFGLPLILNGKYVVPFILGMPLVTVTTYLAYIWFDVEKVQVLIPYSMPVVLGALLATAMGWKAVILALFNLLLLIVIWSPFVIFHSKRGAKKALIEVVSETQKVRVN